MKCSKCGNEVNQGEKFCGKCGANIENISESKDLNISVKLKNFFKKIIETYKSFNKPTKIICIGFIIAIIAVLSFTIPEKIEKKKEAQAIQTMYDYAKDKLKKAGYDTPMLGGYKLVEKGTNNRKIYEIQYKYIESGIVNKGKVSSVYHLCWVMTKNDIPISCYYGRTIEYLNYEDWKEDNNWKSLNSNENKNNKDNVLNTVIEENEKSKDNEKGNNTSEENKSTIFNKDSNLTGIEQAIQDGMIGEDYLTKGVTENKLKSAYTDGNLQLYYDSWEECLRDARKLDILLPDEEPSINELYTYFGGENNINENNVKENNSKEDDIKEDITHLKAYNTSKMEGTSVYHIIRIYKYSNGELSYESYVCTYGEITSSVDCDFKFKTIEDALEHATECYTTNFKIEDLIEEDVTDKSLFDSEFIGKYTSKDKPIFIKAYNTLKLEEELSYHIIKLYEFSDGKFTYETYWNNYGSSILSRKSNYIKFNTIEEALKSATKSEQINMKTVEELTEE